MIEAFEDINPKLRKLNSETTGKTLEYIADDFKYKLKYDGNEKDLQNFIVGYVYHRFWKKFQTYTGISKDKYEKDEVYLDPILYQIELMLQDLMKLIFVKK